MNSSLSTLFFLAMTPLVSAQVAGELGKVSLPASVGMSFDEVHYDAPGDGRLWARGATYKASFGAEGATYIPFLGSDAPRNMPVRMQLASATLGGIPLELTPTAQWSREGDRVILERGPVDVHYLMGVDSIEQTFVLDRLPRDGDLLVRVAVESDLQLSTAGAGFRFSGERGGVNYGAATVIDGAGRSLGLESRLEAGAISIRVPAEYLREARLPLVVDPLITTYGVSLGADSCRGGDPAYDASSGTYLHVYAFSFSLVDRDVIAVAADQNGSLVPDSFSFIDVSQTDWYDPQVASNNSGNNCMVVATVEINDQSQIWGRIRSLPGVGMGNQVQISPSSAYNCNSPSIGGDSADDGANLFCVAWRKVYPGVETHIRYRTMSNTGLQVGASQTIDGSPLKFNRDPHVSKSCGTGSASERRWNIVWSQDDLGDDSDIYGAQISSLGLIVTPTFPVDSTAIPCFDPAVSAPLDSPTGGKRDFLAVYHAQVNNDLSIRGRMFRQNSYLGTYYLTEMEADVVGNAYLGRAQYAASIGTDESQFVVSYTETAVDGTQDIYMCSLRHQGSTLALTEAHTLIADTDTGLVGVGLATQHDGGELGSRSMAIGITEYVGQGQFRTHGAQAGTPDGWGLLGQTLCSGELNSTGGSANFRIFGSDDPNDNQLVLDVNNLPTFSYGQFIMSKTTQSMPLDNGTLCLGQPLLRIGASLGSAWVTGTVGHKLDLSALPAGAAVQPGQTWYFQYWYRDAGSSNLSNAEGVTFQ